MNKRLFSVFIFCILVMPMLACRMSGSATEPATPIAGEEIGKTAVAAAAATMTAIKPSDVPLTQTALPPTATLTSTATLVPSETPILATVTPTATATNTPLPCNAVQYVSDVTYVDDSEVKAGTSFTKTWRLKNTGSCTWTADYRLIFASGDAMSAAAETVLTTGQTPPGETLDASVALVAPEGAGTYRGAFKLRAPDGTTFGIGASGAEAFWVQVVVVAPPVFERQPTRPVILVKPTKTLVIVPALKRNLKLTNPYMQGEDVKNLQTRLIALGYTEVENADGIFGPKTDAAVRHFQQDKGLTVDGIVGSQTWKALYE